MCISVKRFLLCTNLFSLLNQIRCDVTFYTMVKFIDLMVKNKFVHDERYLSHFVHVRQSRKCKVQLK
jgi:hypothetical protein